MAEPTTQSSTSGATSGATIFVTISDVLDHVIPKSVYIGVGDSYDFKGADDVWVAHAGCVTGSTLGIRPKAARHTSGSTAPDAGDIIFHY